MFALLGISKEVCLEVDAEKTKYIHVLSSVYRTNHNFNGT